MPGVPGNIPSMTQEHASRRRRRLTATVTDLTVTVQRAFLIGVVLPGGTEEEEERSLEELALLTDTAGAEVVDMELVRRSEIDPATYIGKGKAKELAQVAQAMDIDVVIFDHQLTPAQQRNLQNLFGCDVVDREGLILDIFAQHARSKIGALQVELALLRYHLPRLRGKGKSMSQQASGAGITNRGPGETKLELDRRRILTRISKLERELKESTSHQETQRKKRGPAHPAGVDRRLHKCRQVHAPQCPHRRRRPRRGPLVRHTRPDRPTVREAGPAAFPARRHRRVRAPAPTRSRRILRSTLQEAADADLLIHLVDATDPDLPGQIAAVRESCPRSGDAVPELLVLNKSDALTNGQRQRISNLYPDALLVSAITGEGLSVGRCDQHRPGDRARDLSLAIPYERETRGGRPPNGRGRR